MFKIEKERICGWFLHAVVGSNPTPASEFKAYF